MLTFPFPFLLRPIREQSALVLGLATVVLSLAANVPRLPAQTPPPPSTPVPATPVPLRAEFTRYPRETPDLRIRFPAACSVLEAPNGAVLAAPADSSFLMTVFPAPDARDAKTSASATQELIGYLRLGTKLEVLPVEEVRTVSGQVFFLTGASGKDLLGKDIFYEVAVGTPEENGDYFYAVAAIYPTDAARRAHTAAFRESVRSIRVGEEEAAPAAAAATPTTPPAATSPGPARN